MATSILKLYAEPLIKGQRVSPSPFSQWAGRGRDPVWRAANESLGGLGQAEWGPEPICPSCLGNPVSQPLTETAGTTSSGGRKGPAQVLWVDTQPVLTCFQIHGAPFLSI